MRYSRLFQYLFRLKRMQLELETTWAALGGHRAKAEEGGTSRGTAAPPLWQVRGHMAHFINNLQLYIQVPQPPPLPPSASQVPIDITLIH